MQSGRRTGISQTFERRNFPFEVTAYMYHGNFTSTKVVSDQLYTKYDLH